MAEQSTGLEPSQTAATRERILRAALGLIYERGYRGASVHAIAARVGISAPALYWHFSSKRELCYEALRAELSRFVAALEPCQEEPSPQARLRAFVRAYVLFKLAQSRWLRTPGAVAGYAQARAALTAHQQSQLDEMQRRVLKLMRHILIDGRRAGTFSFVDTTATAFAIVTMCEYVFHWVRPEGRLSAEEVADRYCDLALAMTRAPEASTEADAAADGVDPWSRGREPT